MNKKWTVLISLCFVFVIVFVSMAQQKRNVTIPDDVATLVQDYMNAYKNGTAESANYIYFEDEFKIDPNKLKSLITDKTKMIVLPFPNNPTGAIMTKEELNEIADIVRDTNIVILLMSLVMFFLGNSIFNKSVIDLALNKYSR